MTKLSPPEVEAKLKQLPDWRLEDDGLVKDFKFKNFVEAFGFMTSAALVAEKLNHHPDWTNVYNRVTVRLITHDVGGLTELDFELAQQMDSLAWPRQ